MIKMCVYSCATGDTEAIVQQGDDRLHLCDLDPVHERLIRFMMSIGKRVGSQEPTSIDGILGIDLYEFPADVAIDFAGVEA